MPKEAKKKINTHIRQNTFSHIGNLAFYGGWSPDYIYFKSLENADKYFITSNGPRQWDPAQAGPIAEKAISDALAHQYLKNNSQEDSTKYFEEQFTNKIIPFLEKAYQYEKTNERRWIDLKYKELKRTFGEDSEKLKPINELYDKIKNIDKGFNYAHYMTLINLILSGVQETKQIIDYEEERINEMRDVIAKLIKSRMSQTEGVLRHSSKTYDEKIISQIQSARRLNEKLEAEYINTGSLSRTEDVIKKDGTIKTKYAIFGGKEFSKIKPTIDNVIKIWSETVIKDIMQNPIVLSQIMENLSKSMPQIMANKKKSLEQQIKKIIVLAILDYGSKNLTQLLNKQLNASMIAAVKQDLITNTQIFDTARNIQVNIKGLQTDEVVTIIKEADLLKNAESFADLYKSTAKGLYSLVDSAISSMSKSQEQESTLYKILNNPSSKAGRNYDQTKQIIELIHSVEEVQKQLDKMIEDYHKKNADIVKQVHIPQNPSIGITISIINGIPRVEENELLQAIKGTEAFSYMGFQQFSAESQREMINKLKARASINLKKDIIQSISSGLYNIEPDEITQKLKHELQRIEVSVESSNLMEALAAMQFQTVGDRLSGITPKNGVISISFAYEDIMQSLRTTINNDEMLTKKYAVIERHYTQAQNNFYETMYKEINSGIKRVSQKNTKKSRTKLMYSIIQNSEKETKQIADAMERLAKWGDKYTELNSDVKTKEAKFINSKQEQFMEDLLNNSVYVSTVVTNNNNYMNNIGFLGNSLGDTLEAQLIKIASIFRQAGIPIPKEELQWMRFAVLNCFEGSILGTSNKNMIENYLGSLIAFALFNEGGVEASIIADTFEKYYKNTSNIFHTPKMLTIYKVDSIYVPGSVIIKRTLEALKKDILPAIRTKIPNTLRRGAGITIINNVNESLIPNRPLRAHLDSQDKRAWLKVGMAAQNKVKIQVLFLAGLLDIIKSINKTLGELEIPA